MSRIPVPELLAALVLTLVLYGIRALPRLWRAKTAHRTRAAAPPAGVETAGHRRQARLLASCITLVFVSIPLILELVPPNGSYGFRTPLTRTSPAVWYAANAFMGWALSAAAVISAAALLALPPTARRPLQWAAFLVPLFVAIAASFLYLDRLT